jgi:lipopolysaccharide/colanic/teichoic acid biosynthesis glycosyltransferase
VSARSDGDLEVQQARDTYYIRHWSIWIDFYILSRTPSAVVGGAARADVYRPPSGESDNSR